MSNYVDDVQMCRVDFFKSSGKWYTTEAVRFHNDLYSQHAIDAFKTALQRHLGDRLQGMTAVCLEPYVSYPFPLMLINIG